MTKRNEVRERSYRFSLCLIPIERELSRGREFVVSRQMLRSGTAIGANVEEALAAQSRRDFLSKMSIARKECRECLYWLRLLRDSELLDFPTAEPLLSESAELLKILTAIIKSTARDC